jgi:tetratricopeptide (TPR) repeat protein
VPPARPRPRKAPTNASASHPARCGTATDADALGEGSNRDQSGAAGRGATSDAAGVPPETGGAAAAAGGAPGPPGVERRHQAAREKEKGNDFFRGREFEEALAAYDAALALDAGLVAARCNRAAANLKLERWADAERDCNAVLAVDAT